MSRDLTSLKAWRCIFFHPPLLQILPLLQLSLLKRPYTKPLTTVRMHAYIEPHDIFKVSGDQFPQQVEETRNKDFGIKE